MGASLMMKRTFLPILLGVLILGFWHSPDLQSIAAGVAIFLFGMLMLEDGFKLFSGGMLERVLARSTDSLGKSVAFGIVTTTIMQSSSLVSVITISFLSASLISLAAGVGIIFGANLGTTTGAWLVAGFGLKVKISAYALPMLAISIVLVFQRSNYLRGIGLVLAGLGFLFLGIHYMKEGFEAFKDQFDLTRFAMTGVLGLVVYTLVGAAATVVMQSSHATMVLIITALAVGQVSYENAIALAIGANIGTTVTAIIGAVTANFQGRRLALAHLVFNLVTAGVAIGLINQIVWSVDWISAGVGIAPDDFALKLAVFHTIFNLLGVALMVPFMSQLLAFLERAIPEPEPDVSKPRYLTETLDGFPETIELALRKEVKHLYDNAVELIAHGLNLHLDALYSSEDIAATVSASRDPRELDLDEVYEARVKTLHAAIVEFAIRADTRNLPRNICIRIQSLREAAQRCVHAVKAVKHMRRNATAFTSHSRGPATDLYNVLRTEIARILVEIHKLAAADPERRTSLWLDQARVEVERDRKNTTRLIEEKIRSRQIDATTATSFLNDSGYAYEAMTDLIEVARALMIETDGAMAEIEEILRFEDEDIEELAERAG